MVFAGRWSGNGNGRRGGFTLVELLVVIAIIGVLVALLLPAVQAAREASRRTQCQNHLRQAVLSFHNHHDTFQYLPTGGWGWNWVGDPDRGPGIEQPGGWVFNSLPFLEQKNTYDIGAGGTFTAKFAPLGRRNATAVAVMYCPSRRKPGLYPTPDNPPITVYNADWVPRVAKTDYAANCGSFNRNEIDGGPAPNAQTGAVNPPAAPSVTQENGISYRVSKVRLAEITDGTTQTFMVGEKFLTVDRWLIGTDPADNENMYVGYDNDIYRSSNVRYFPPKQDRKQNTISGDQFFTWGSAHPGGFNMGFCDGSVHIINYQINATAFANFGSRNDGQQIDYNF